MVNDLHAIIRKGSGEYYLSAVFGYYSDKKSEYNYGAYFRIQQIAVCIGEELWDCLISLRKRQ